MTAWSGDVLSDWVTFQRQIPAGLNYSISGMPYWTTDIGGFISGGNLNDPKFRELFVRWFQFGAFSPDFPGAWYAQPQMRTNCGSYGADAQKILVDYDTLRYRLMPYIYSRSMAGDEQSRDADAAAGDGLARGCGGAEYRG